MTGLPSNSSRSQEPKDAHPHLTSVIPKTEVVDDTGPKKSLENSEENTANEHACQIERCILKETSHGPSTDTESDPLPLSESCISTEDEILPLKVRTRDSLS